MLSIQELACRRSTITRAFSAAAALLVMIHIGWKVFTYFTGHDYVHGLIKLFHLDVERNVPTVFSTLLLLSAAALLFHIRRHERLRGSRDVAKWTVLAIGFGYMAIDEIGHIHELLIRPGRELLGDRAFGPFYYAWVIPASAIVLVLAAYFLGFLQRLPAPTRLGFIIGGLLFVGGAIGLEMLEGRHDELYGERNVTYQAYVTIEEAMEMAGVIVFIHALLGYINQYLGVGPPGDSTRARHSRATAHTVQVAGSGIRATTSLRRRTGAPNGQEFTP